MVALAIGSAVTGITYAFFKKDMKQEDVQEEEAEIDLDINII